MEDQNIWVHGRGCHCDRCLGTSFTTVSNIRYITFDSGPTDLDDFDVPERKFQSTLLIDQNGHKYTLMRVE